NKTTPTTAPMMIFSQWRTPSTVRCFFMNESEPVSCRGYALRCDDALHLMHWPDQCVLLHWKGSGDDAKARGARLLRFHGPSPLRDFGLLVSSTLHAFGGPATGPSLRSHCLPLKHARLSV